MAGLGPTELLIVLGIILLLFGAARLPHLARSLGSAKREFEQGQVEPGTHRVGPDQAA
jgi:sec-independent protein translocase protein TatA